MAVLDSRCKARGDNLSGGYAQSVALARVFLRRSSRILILDESMSAMDTFKKQEIILPNLLRFVRQHGMTLILISHDMSVLELVDQVIVLDAGRLVHRGTYDQLLAQGCIVAFLKRCL